MEKSAPPGLFPLLATLERKSWRLGTKKGSSHVKTTADIIIKIPPTDKWIGSDESLGWSSFGPAPSVSRQQSCDETDKKKQEATHPA
jgi:hypothetical protein